MLLKPFSLTAIKEEALKFGRISRSRWGNEEFNTELIDKLIPPIEIEPKEVFTKRKLEFST